MTQHMYDVTQRYRDLGGNLMFLSANNFFWKVTRKGQVLKRVQMWRKLGRPEAGLVGVQWVAGNQGQGEKPYVVDGDGFSRAGWAFERHRSRPRLVLRRLRCRDRRARGELAGEHASCSRAFPTRSARTTRR